jgi:glycerate 2-kinase
MNAPTWASHVPSLEVIRGEALRAVDPRRLVASGLAYEGGILTAGERRFVLARGGTLAIVALGKAASGMAAAAADILQGTHTRGLVVAPRAPGNLPPRFEFVRGGHPLSNEGSLEAGRRIALLARSLTAADILLTLISGGGSALVEVLRPPLTLDDLREVQEALLRSGADIRAFNLVRASLSQIKRGGLAQLAEPAQTIGLILSDIVGNPLADVASGPTVDQPASAAEARALLTRLSLWEKMPAAVHTVLKKESPAREPVRPPPHNFLIGSSATAAEAALEAARLLGFDGDIVSLAVEGEAVRAGRQIAALLIEARDLAQQSARPRALVFAGETTVTVRGHGRGGRNQECALGAALALAGTEGVALMSLATDGVDGNSDAAGATVTGETVARAQAQGLRIDDALQGNDSHTVLHALGACMHIGPTGTNVNDLMVGLVYP